MNRNLLLSAVPLMCIVAGGMPAAAQTSGNAKIAIINIQDAITRTQEGQKLARELQERYGPTRDQIESQQREIQSLRDQLNRGANTMSEDARRQLLREIQMKERDLKRDMEDAQAEFNQAQQEALNEISGKLMTVIDKYAKEKDFSIVLDVSSPQSPVLYAVNEILITNDIIQRYDQEHPVEAAASTTSESTPTPAAKPSP